MDERLQKRLTEGNLRCLQLVDKAVDFASNDYLGLAKSPVMQMAFTEEWNNTTQAIGSTGSRLLTGNSSYATALEAEIAAFHGYASGLLFTCGYMANLGLISAVATREDLIFFDTHVHASIRDGISLSQARAFPFKHNDLNHLEKRLQTHYNTKKIFICIESIYSTNGSTTNLEDFCYLANKYNAHLIVDEAHAVGIIGNKGRGAVAKAKLEQNVFAQVVTFGKALGTQGAIVLGNRALKEILINFSKSFIYTTSNSLLNLIAIKCAYGLFPHMEQQRMQLDALVAYFNQLFETQSKTPIQPILLSKTGTLKHYSQMLLNKGIDARAFLRPTVPKGEECLRICLHTYNTKEEIACLHHLIKQL